MRWISACPGVVTPKGGQCGHGNSACAISCRAFAAQSAGTDACTEDRGPASTREHRRGSEQGSERRWPDPAAPRSNHNRGGLIMTPLRVFAGVCVLLGVIATVVSVLPLSPRRRRAGGPPRHPDGNRRATQGAPWYWRGLLRGDHPTNAVLLPISLARCQWRLQPNWLASPVLLPRAAGSGGERF